MDMELQSEYQRRVLAGRHDWGVDQIAARTFAQRWVQEWNAHDIDAVLGHFSDDVIFTSPHAAQLLRGCDGTVRGKDALRRYWQEGLRRVPDLRFELLGVYAGVHTLVINYRNQKGGLASEILTFDGPLITSGHGTYLEDQPYHRADMR